MNETTVHLHPAFSVGPVDERIFGGFAEHIGRCIYEGLYEPHSPQADEHGCRKDVLAALHRLQMTAMRYPGGNFASGYHWADGVGPRSQRPAVRELAWQSTETNHFGTDEFLALCRRMNWQPMLTANLGTGTPEEARNWLEYCNSPTGTKYADQRAANGHPEPYGVKLWCLGNEMDGPWQLGHVPAEQYAIRDQQAAKMMKDCDRSAELVVCGSCGVGMPTYMEWDRQVLEYVGDFADYVSLHRYVDNRAGDTADFLAISNGIDRQIEEMDAACRIVLARRRSKKRVGLCFDEWNVWYKNMQMDGQGKLAPHLVEEIYNLEDALVVAAFLHSFLRHADAVKIANLAQIVNVIAPLLTDGPRLLVQSTFYAFEMFSRRRKGVSLRPAVEGPTYEGKSNGQVHFVDASAILEGQRLHVFLTNRSLDHGMQVRLDLAGRSVARLENAEILFGKDPKAHNDWDAPNAVRPLPFGEVAISKAGTTLSLPPLSLVAATLALE